MENQNAVKDGTSRKDVRFLLTDLWHFFSLHPNKHRTVKKKKKKREKNIN